MGISLIGQKNDPVLFTVAGKPVHTSEFLYIYSKTNREKADFSKASLEEYLDLYTKGIRRLSAAISRFLSIR